MHVETLRYHRGRGWNAPLPTGLDSTQTLVLALASPMLDELPRLLEDVRRALPKSHLIGCSTAGEIHGGGVFDESLVLAVARFDRTPLRSASVPLASASESRAAGAAIGAQLASADLRAVFVLSDGLSVNGSALVAGVASAVGEDVKITGGLAGDGPRFARTFVIDGERARPNTVRAVGFYGDRLRFGHGSRGGWDIFGPERVITRSEGNVLFELDGRPALALYKDYLGDRASELPAAALLFPLGIRASRTDPRQLVRTILSVNEADQSMTFAGDVPQGAISQLMRANLDRLILGASDAADFSLARLSKPSLSIAVSCVGRRLVLGERVEEEIEATIDAMPRGTAQVGFYSYGEISPTLDGPSGLHNQTMTITTLAEV